MEIRLLSQEQVLPIPPVPTVMDAMELALQQEHKLVILIVMSKFQAVHVQYVMPSPQAVPTHLILRVRILSMPQQVMVMLNKQTATIVIQMVEQTTAAHILTV